MNCIYRYFTSILIALLYFSPVYGDMVPIVKQSLSNKHVNALVQDREGYVWIGTAKGLNKYNGYEYFQYFHVDDDISSLPSDLVTALFIDSGGTMWIATDLGIARYDPDSDNFRQCNYSNVNSSIEYGFIEIDDRIYVYGQNGVKRICPETLDLESVRGTSGMQVSCITRDGHGNLWLGCYSTQGIYFAESDFSGLVKIYSSPSTDINCSYLLSDNIILFGSNTGVIAFDTATMAPTSRDGGKGSSRPLALPFGNDIRRLNVTFFYRPKNGILFMGTQNEGLYVCNWDSGQLVKSSDYNLFSEVQSPHCTVCYTSTDGVIWLGTFDQGYYTAPGIDKRFNNDRILNEYLQGKFVTRIVESEDGALWIGTRHNGLIRYDPASGKFTSYTKHRFPPFMREGSDFIQSLYIDSRGLLWVGYEKKLMYCNIGKSGILSYRVFDIYSDIITINEDQKGRIWTGSSSDGITVYDVNKSQSEKLCLPSLCSNITNIARLHSGDMLFACYGHGLLLSDAKTGEIRKMALPEEITPFTRRCVSLLETDNSDLWIGTYTKGVVRLKTHNGDFDVYQNISGGANGDVVAMAEAEDGCIWLSTSFGLAKFDPTTAHFYNYYDSDGTGGNQFHEKAVYKSGDGTIYFGGNHGLTFFNPARITVDNKPVTVAIEDLKVLNKQVRRGDETGILRRNISHTDTIVLNHRYNVFSIDYSGIDYRSSQKIKYAYILHNFDKKWNYVGDYRRASYSNLPPGKYLFEVKTQNPDGIWADSGRTLFIVVKHAPWLHPLAIAGYLLIAMCIAILLVRMHIQGRINKEKIKLVEQQRVFEHQINELKIQFFTNISHELRTPLSLIFGPAKKLLQENNAPEDSRRLIKLLNYYADNLLRLIDQIMDFAKLENETLSLQVSPASAAGLVREIIGSYAYMAKEKGIEVRLESDVEGEIQIDEDKYRKIVSNLLSNALKYTPCGGHVCITIRLTDASPVGFSAATPNGRFLVTSVADDGVGIAPEDLAHLFERHRRFGREGKLTAMVPGNGIGLHYVKSLVEIHKGDIQARNRDKGLDQTFILPADEHVYTQAERRNCLSTEIHGGAVITPAPELSAANIYDIPHSNKVEKKTDSLLIVEDNPDLLKFIHRIFSDEYADIDLAVNGAEAVEICRNKNISLIISDIVMPVMDGIELCSTVKNDPELCHILVVLLTARNETSNQIKGYSVGADTYIGKPFDPMLLQTVVANLLANRLRLRSTLLNGELNENSATEKSAVETDPTGTAILNPLDSKFVEKLYAYIDQNLSNTTINVNALGKELGFSRTSFYRKVKNLTGYSPNDFLRSYRLHKATVLLKNPEYSIAEIADMIGCGTHSYFSKSFKEEFGISPKDFRIKHLPTASFQLPDPKTEQGNQ